MEIKKTMPVFESKSATMQSNHKNTDSGKSNQNIRQNADTKSFSEILEKEIEEMNKRTDRK